MIKKISAIVAIAAIAFFAAPAAANADVYVPFDQAGGTVQALAGATVDVAFPTHTFAGSEPVGVSVSGDPVVTFAAIRAVGSVSPSSDLNASADGSLSFKVTVSKAAAAGTVYTATALGRNSNVTAVFHITIVPADSGKALPRTGGTIPVMIIWGGAGLLLLGIALLVVFGVVRRQRRHV